jgi:purine-binding chemotaxis protein CheW
MSYNLILLSRAGGRTCALSLNYVLEILRPLPVNPVANMPSFMLGLSIIRGHPIPVVSLSRLLGIEAPAAFTRFVSLSVDKRIVALAVEAVDGILNTQSLAFSELPPLLKGSDAAVVESVGTLDSQLLMVLNAARMLPEEFWLAHELESAP